MIACPNINHEDYKYAVEKLGKHSALYLYDLLGQEIPTKDQVDSYLDSIENESEGIIQEDLSEYGSITVGSKFEGKQELLDKFRIKRSRSHYYYVLSKEEQRRVDSYVTGKWTKGKLGRTINGFEISDTINGRVRYKYINNKPYLLIDIKEIFEEDGIKLPRKIGSFKIPIDLVYFGDETDYKEFQKKNIDYVPYLEKEINKYLFKTKGISLAKSMNFYAYKTSKLLIDLFKEVFNKDVTLDQLLTSNIEELKQLLDSDIFKNKLKDIQNQYEEEINNLDADVIRQDILDRFREAQYTSDEEEYKLFDEQFINDLSILLNYLPDNFIKLVPIDVIYSQTAMFMPQTRNNININIPKDSITKFMLLKPFRESMSTNIVLRRLYDKGIITNEDIDKANKLLKPAVKKFIQDTGGDYTISRKKYYNKLEILATALGPDKYTSFEIEQYYVLKEIDDYNRTKLNGFMILMDSILNTSKFAQVNDVFGAIKLGNFTKFKGSFAPDNMTIIGHEIGHGIDRYIATVKPKVRKDIINFINDLIETKEFQNYIKKGLESRGYNITNKKEITADLFAYIALRSINYSGINYGHLKSLNEFFNNNELLISNIFNKYSFDGFNPLGDNTPIKKQTIFDIFRSIINDIIDAINSFVGKNIFNKLTTEEPSLTTTIPFGKATIEDIYTIFNNLITDKSLYEIDNIFNADPQFQAEWNKYGSITKNTPETKEQFIARMNSRIENGMYKQKDGTLVQLTSSYNPETWWVENKEGLVSFDEPGSKGKRTEVLFKFKDASAKTAELYNKYTAEGYTFKFEQVVFPVTGKSKTKNFAPNNRKIYRIRVSKALGRDFDGELVQDYTQTSNELREAQNASREQMQDLFNKLKGKDPRQIIDEILAGEVSDEVRSILTVIRDRLDSNPTLTIIINDEANDKFADYDPNTNTITINSKPHLNRDATEVGISLTHELIHAYTLRAFRNRYTENEKEFATTIERLFNIAKKNTKFKNHPAFTSAEEWLGYVLTEPKIMNEAMKMKLSLWKRFVLAIKKLLGISTVYDEAFNTLIGYLNAADITVYKPNKLQLKLDRQISVELAESKKNQDTYLEKVLTMLDKYDKMFDFNAADHTYTLVRDLDGNELKENEQMKFVSVTQMMRTIGLARKYRLSDDPEKAAKQKAYGERVAGIGNIFHGLVEADINEIAANLADSRFAGLKVHDYALQDVKNFLKRFKDRKITILSEVLVADIDMRLAGTIDLVVIDEQGQVHIYDFKTKVDGFEGDKWNDKKSEYEIQVSVYKDLLEKIIGVNVASLNIVTIKPQIEHNEIVAFALDKSQSNNGIVPIEYNINCKLLFRAMKINTADTPLSDQYISEDVKKEKDEDFKKRMDELYESIQNTINPREKMVLKSIQQLEVKRRLLYRSGSQYEIQSVDKVINDLIAEKDVEKQLITIIKYAWSTANRIDVEIKKYRTEGKNIPIELLKKWKDSVLAFDAILNEKDGLETLLTKEHGLSGGPEYRDTLNKVIRLGNSIKSLYQDAGYDQLVEFLSPYYHRLYAELRLIKTKEYRRKKFLGEIPNNITERDYVEKAIDDNEDDLQTRTKELLLKEIKKASRDIGLMTRWIDNLLDTKDPVTAAMIKAFVYTDEKARIESLNKRNELVRILRKVEDYYRTTGRIPKSNEDFYSFMLEKDSKGEFTGYLLRPYTSAMMAEYRKIREDARELDTPEKRSAFISAWLNGDEYLPGNMPLDKEKFLNAYHDFIEEQFKEGNITEKEKDNIRDNELFKNKATVKEMVDSGALSFQTGEILGSWLSENTWSFRTPNEKWVNKDYEKLDAILKNPNDPRAELYNYIVRMSREADMHLPFGFRLDGRLPGVIKQNHERIASGHGIFETSKMAMTRQLTFTIDDVNRTHEELIDLAGNPKYFLPIHFTRRITKKVVKLSASGEEYTEEEYDPMEQSFDLPNIYFKYWQMANDYFHKAQILPEMELAKFIIENRPTTKRDSFGNAVLKHLGSKKRYHDLPEEQRDLYEREITGSYLSQQVNDWFMSCVYGEYEKDAGQLGKLDVGKLLNTINSYTSLNLLGVNFVAGTANVILGETLQRIESFAGEYMSPTDFMYADKYYMQHFGGIIADVGARDTSSLAGLLIDEFGILDDYGKTTFDQRTRFGQLSKMDTLYFTSHLGEHYMQSRFLFGLLANKKVKNLEGNEIGRLLDQYVVNKGKLVLKQELEMKPAEYQMFLKINKWTDADQQAFKMKTRGILSRLHGEYSKLGRVAIQRSALGRMAYLFRHFVVPGFRRRWGTSMWIYKTDKDGVKHKVLNPAAYSERLEQFIEGNYITTGRFIGTVTKTLFGKNKDTKTADDFFGRMISDLQSTKMSLIGAEWASLTDHEKANIYRTLYEVTFLISAIILASVASNLKGDAGDDDDELEAKWWAFIAYQAYRLQNELLFFTPKLDSAMSILRSPAASMSFVENLIDLSGQIFHPLDRYESGNWKGRLKIVKTLNKMAPGVRQIYRLKDIDEQLPWMQRSAFGYSTAKEREEKEQRNK